MSRIVLTTLNARYIPAPSVCDICTPISAKCAVMRKFLNLLPVIAPRTMAEKILDEKPQIVGIGVAIWNARESSELVRILKAICPELLIVLGGPEVSHEPLRVDFDAVDYIIAGEGEEAFCSLCRNLLSGERPADTLHPGSTAVCPGWNCPTITYSDEDVRNRVIYLEASRGCPWGCEFCLSSIDRRVRYLKPVGFWRHRPVVEPGRPSLQVHRPQFQTLDQGNALTDSRFLSDPGSPIHGPLRDGAVIVTRTDEETVVPLSPWIDPAGGGGTEPESGVASRIGRPLDVDRIIENLGFLSRETRFHLHLDLIFGLPGENLESMASGLDRLMKLGRGEIQLGILKKTVGTAIARHDGPFAMIFSPLPPYGTARQRSPGLFNGAGTEAHGRFWDLCHQQRPVQDFAVHALARREGVRFLFSLSRGGCTTSLA
jgi:hypothetical protein